MRGFLFGIVFTLIVLVGTGLLAVTNGWIPVNADGGYLPFERWAASRALNAAIRREMPKGPLPIQPTSANLIAGIKLYAQNCEVCHGAADGKPTTISKGLYQHAPRLAEHGVEDDPEGETYWKIAHGIRWTGMPSFGKTLNDRQIWQLTLFLKHMDDLPADAQGVWRNVKNTASRQPKTAPRRTGSSSGRSRGSIISPRNSSGYAPSRGSARRATCPSMATRSSFTAITWFRRTAWGRLCTFIWRNMRPAVSRRSTDTSMKPCSIFSTAREPKSTTAFATSGRPATSQSCIIIASISISIAVPTNRPAPSS